MDYIETQGYPEACEMHNRYLGTISYHITLQSRNSHMKADIDCQFDNNVKSPWKEASGDI